MPDVIARPSDTGVLLITQPDHAHLARRIMERCAALHSHPRRDDILYAVGEHDNGWAETDAAPVVDRDSGGIADFVRLPLNERHEVWRRGVARIAGRPWPAALVAHHAVTVYDRYRSDPAWLGFFAEMEAVRDAMAARAAVDRGHLESDYAFVRLGDLLSLAFCTGANDRPAFGPWNLVLDGSRIVVTPDIFGGETMALDVAGREIPGRPFESDEDLRAAVRHAREVVIHGTAAGRA